MGSETPGIGHNRPDVAVDDADLPAIKTGLKLLPPDFSLRRTLLSAEKHYVQHAAAKRSAYHELRYGLQQSLQAFLHLAGNPDRQVTFVEQCKEKGISTKKGTPLECAVIRYSYSGLSDEKVNRYANAIREAIHQNVRPDRFARHLAKRGQGVNALHAAFKARKQGKSELNNDLNNKSDIDASEESEQRSDKTSKVVITCAKKRIPKLLALKIGEAIQRCAIKRVNEKSFEVTKF